MQLSFQFRCPDHFFMLMMVPIGLWATYVFVAVLYICYLGFWGGLMSWPFLLYCLKSTEVDLEVHESQSLWMKSVGLWFNPWPLPTTFWSLLSKIMMMVLMLRHCCSVSWVHVCKLLLLMSRSHTAMYGWMVTFSVKWVFKVTRKPLYKCSPFTSSLYCIVSISTLGGYLAEGARLM